MLVLNYISDEIMTLPTLLVPEKKKKIKILAAQ